jgi:hypothetical protein
MMKKISKFFFKLLYFLWGVYSLLLVTISTLTDISRVLNKSNRIDNWYWFLGMIPGLFYVVYLISLKAKGSIFLKKISSILGILSLFVFVMFFQTSGFNWALLIVALFPISVFIRDNFSNIFKKKESKKKKGKDSDVSIDQNTSTTTIKSKFLVIMLIIVCLFLAFLYGQSVALERVKKEKVKGEMTSVKQTQLNETVTLSPSPTKAPTFTSKKASTVNNSSLIDCIGPDGKEFKTSESECKKLNESWGKSLDYMVNCNVSETCGGGTRRVKKSECDNSTCCQIGSSWVFYTSKDKCIQDQKNQIASQYIPPATNANTSPTSSKVPVYLTYSSYSIYCPSQNVSAIQAIDAEMKSKKDKWDTDYVNCSENFYKKDPCYISCYNLETSQLNSCYSQFSYSGNDSTACKSKAFDDYGSCIKSCPSARESCDYVYLEQKNLSSQINNLCK